MSKNKDLSPVQGKIVPEENNTAPVKAQRGRPKGAKNKDTVFKELMSNKFQGIAEKEIQKTFKILFEKAHEGDMKAIKLIMDRVVPMTKSVDLDDLDKKGLTINISVGNMEDSPINGEVIEDAQYEEVN